LLRLYEGESDSVQQLFVSMPITKGDKILIKNLITNLITLEGYDPERVS